MYICMLDYRFAKLRNPVVGVKFFNFSRNTIVVCSSLPCQLILILLHLFWIVILQAQLYIYIYIYIYLCLTLSAYFTIRNIPSNTTWTIACNQEKITQMSLATLKAGKLLRKIFSHLLTRGIIALSTINDCSSWMIKLCIYM